MKTGKRFQKAVQAPWRSRRERRLMRRMARDCRDYWAIEVWDLPTPGRLIPASKHGRGRWRR